MDGSGCLFRSLFSEALLAGSPSAVRCLPLPYQILSIRFYRKWSQIQRGWLASDHEFSDECWVERYNFSDRRHGFSVDNQPSVTDSA
jgi:hypothetical protein